jgi:hypothetical protein
LQLHQEQAVPHLHVVQSQPLASPAISNPQEVLQHNTSMIWRHDDQYLLRDVPTHMKREMTE